MAKMELECRAGCALFIEAARLLSLEEATAATTQQQQLLRLLLPLLKLYTGKQCVGVISEGESSVALIDQLFSNLNLEFRSGMLWWTGLHGRYGHSGYSARRTSNFSIQTIAQLSALKGSSVDRSRPSGKERPTFCLWMYFVPLPKAKAKCCTRFTNESKRLLISPLH